MTPAAALHTATASVMAGYTPKRREAFLKGFRILADVAIRAHIQGQAALPLPLSGPTTSPSFAIAHESHDDYTHELGKEHVPCTHA